MKCKKGDILKRTIHENSDFTNGKEYEVYQDPNGRLYIIDDKKRIWATDALQSTWWKSIKKTVKESIEDFTSEELNEIIKLRNKIKIHEKSIEYEKNELEKVKNKLKKLYEGDQS